MWNLDLLRGAIIVLLIVLFTGLVIWLWFIADRRRFDEAARLPLDDDAAAGRAAPLGASNHE